MAWAGRRLPALFIFATAMMIGTLIALAVMFGTYLNEGTP